MKIITENFTTAFISKNGIVKVLGSDSKIKFKLLCEKVLSLLIIYYNCSPYGYNGIYSNRDGEKVIIIDTINNWVEIPIESLDSFVGVLTNFNSNFFVKLKRYLVF